LINRQNLKKQFKIDLHVLFPFIITLILWVIFYCQKEFNLDVKPFGLIPRNFASLTGIVTHFFVHGSFNHILSNTLSFLVLSLLLFTGYRKIAFGVFFNLLLSTGTILWLIGRNIENGKTVYHIGASGVIFSLFGFLLLSGLIRKNKPQMALSALVIFLYGYLVWGIFPIEKQISWDGHLSGLLGGLIFAFLYSKKEPKSINQIFTEEEENALDNLPPSEKYWLQKNQEDSIEENNIKVNYNPIILNFKYDYKEEDPKTENKGNTKD
jgi:membrane associated rhomboid family serine protease